MHRGPWHLAELPTIATTSRVMAWRRFLYDETGAIIAVEWSR